MEPEEVTFQVLEEITNGFSEDRKLGAGAFGTVYKGVTKNGEDVAVKMLHDVNLDDKQFQNEFNNLSMLKHPNTVQVLGYCYETKHTSMEFNGMTVLAEKTHRALCFEYLPNGSLEKHLTDVFHGFDWHTRYKIVKGTCEGLKYLHNGSKNPIYHLDLKPDNILLDKKMVPKIADFGLSMMFRKEQTRTTQSRLGTLGYQPQEHIENGEISNKFDIFSLGVVMIKILSGHEGYSKSADLSSDEFIDLVQNNWKDRLQKTWGVSSLDAYCEQVKTCTEVALECVENNSEKRPDIVKIINKLNEVEALIGKDAERSEAKARKRNSTLSHSRGSQAVEPSAPASKRRKRTCPSHQPEAQETCSSIVSNKDNPDHTQHFSTRTIAISDGQEFVGIRETSPNIAEPIVGRAKEKEKIIASLLENKMRKVIILPIHGIGGIGKTTFAKLIYDNFKDHTRVWVYVSQIFDLNKIGNSIISQLSGKDNQYYVEQDDVENHITNLVSGKKILIVLDDLWEDDPFELGRLKDMLSLGKKNNTTVLVTTRSELIAKKICMNHNPYKIKGLIAEHCWEIIKQRSAFDARYDREYLEDIGKEIAHKCCGVALAAQSVGFMLNSKTTDEWEKVNRSMFKDATCIDDVLPSLKLSYDSLTKSLKSCFTYCTIFPKGSWIPKDDLVYQWISLGFIKPTRLLSTTQLCDKYIMQLLGLSFLQRSLLPEIAESCDKDAIIFTMHDLVHDLARSIIADEILDCNEDYHTGECMGRSPRYACLTDCTESLELYTTSPEEIRAMFFRKCYIIPLRGEALSSAMSLQVLDLSGCLLETLPDSLSQLKQLRYLYAPKIFCPDIPYCITKLTKLVYLNLCGSLMEALPESIGKLKDLLYLDISGCKGINVLPKTFPELKRLVHLNLSNCDNLMFGLIYLADLTNLQYLNLSNCANLMLRLSYLAGLTNLQYLNLSIWKRNGMRIISIEDLEVTGNFTELRYLNLSGISAVGCHYSDVLKEITRKLPKCKVDWIGSKT